MIVSYTDPSVLTDGIAERWAEPATDPREIDWPTRQAEAWIPYTVVDGRPVNPAAPTGIHHGRGWLGYWGENRMADAFVTATDRHGRRHLAMVERADGNGWALPGGGVEAGESGAEAAARELWEETGLGIDPDRFAPTAPQVVPDPRATDEAWAVTIVSFVDLGATTLPVLRGSDDAARAEWIPADSYDHLTSCLSGVYGGSVFTAHRKLLAELLG
uniref:NUDIX domain-containing protein n=1 Tax=Nonomuraea sp. CA-251285 TaxID=3240002 RepID=UPI003F491E53